MGRIEDPQLMSVICAKLRELHETGALTVGTIEDLLGLAPRSGYAYYGKTEPDFSAFRTLFRQCGHRDAQAELLGLLIDGTGWIAEYVDAAMDVDGDGDVDTDDMLDAAIGANQKLAAVLAAVRHDYRGSCRLAVEEAQATNEFVGDVIRHLVIVQRVISFLAGMDRRRPCPRRSA